MNCPQLCFLWYLLIFITVLHQAFDSPHFLLSQPRQVERKLHFAEKANEAHITDAIPHPWMTGSEKLLLNLTHDLSTGLHSKLPSHCLPRVALACRRPVLNPGFPATLPVAQPVSQCVLLLSGAQGANTPALQSSTGAPSWSWEQDSGYHGENEA
jgi:hypothetical protein